MTVYTSAAFASAIMQSTIVAVLTLLVSVPPFAHADDTAVRSDSTKSEVHTVSDLFERAREIRFDIGSTKLSESSLPFLDALAAALLREPNVSIEIVCHTSASGDTKKDLVLSRRRSDAVKSALASKGVSSDRLVSIGRGSEDPIAPNITRTGRAHNERIELHRRIGRPNP